MQKKTKPKKEKITKKTTKTIQQKNQQTTRLPRKTIL